MLDKKVILAVRTLAAHNSFRISAEVMGTSAASFSRYISAAETYVGRTIFERNGSGAFLTPAGRSFLNMIDDLHDAGTRFEASVARLRSNGPEHLNIGCGPLTTRTIVAPLLADCLQQSPDLRAYVQVRATKEPLEQLRIGALDVAICDLTHTPDLSDLDILVLRKEPVSFWARPKHPIHQQARVDVAEVFRQPFVTAHLHRHWRIAIAKILGDDEEAWQIVDRLPQVESDDFAFLSDLTCRSDLICAGMREDFAQHRDLGLLKEIRTRETMTWNICAARRKGSQFPMLDLFWDELSRNFTAD
ncbi:LysR family transcriptional regulator [Ruegeria halocynthiae]|uniref:LysR family transcriptional regulator n=1 Tax=Ruegeria halocynthiae TaxID=985054 RepID=UPI00055AFC8E|nr:LysR family transcriptional regulator [Ruegeria halocynthiae]